jgi:hypothetical protein
MRSTGDDGKDHQNGHARARGRLRTKQDRREFLLVEFKQSAMTGRKFAEWAGISYSTFGNWWRADLPAPAAAMALRRIEPLTFRHRL